MCDDDAGAYDLSAAQAMVRLREIARVLGRPLADFFGPGDPESSRQTDGGPPSSLDDEG